MTPLLTIGDAADRWRCDVPEGCDPDALIAGASIDSRTVRPGELFFALPGTTQDGHTFIDAAVRDGAVAAVSTRPARRTFVVPDVRVAMTGLAKTVRERSDATFVAITGSVGKTTTRRLLAGVLSPIAPTYESPHNYNNDLGVSLTLLGVKREHAFVVCEVGTSAPGEVKRLGQLVRPHGAIITAIEPAHLDGLKTLSQVAAEKRQLLDCVGPGGWSVAPASLRIPVTASCTDGVATWSETGMIVDWDGASFPTLLFGEHLSTLVPLVVTAAKRLVPEAVLEHDRFCAALSSVEPITGRCQPTDVAGRLVIDDSYNANPASVRAAVALLSAWPTSGRKIAVLGDMLGLGEASSRYHREVFEAFSSAIELWTFGPRASRYGVPFDDLATIGKSLASTTTAGDVILVKGSRGMRMERVITAFREHAGDPL